MSLVSHIVEEFVLEKVRNRRLMVKNVGDKDKSKSITDTSTKQETRNEALGWFEG